MPSGSPKVTVVIPAYNRAAVVGRAIQSVFAQTCQDFEIMVVDDGSTDGTVAAVTAINDPRVVLVRHERNLGAGPARNTGIRAGTAPYVAFLDSDDEWLPTRLEKLLSVFERSGDRVGMVYTGAERVGADGTVITDIPEDRDDLSRVLLTSNVVGGTSVAMVRRDVLEAVGPFDESLRYTEELDLWLRISQRFAIRYIPEVLVRISQQTLRGRLSGDLAAVSHGREMFCRKHRQALIRHGVLHLFLRESGWVQQRGARNLSEARRFYLKSITACPFAPLTYALFLIACFPLAWQDAAARIKYEIQSWRVAGATRRTIPEINR
jgi:O-antigen biosynthesis protein